LSNQVIGSVFAANNLPMAYGSHRSISNGRFFWLRYPLKRVSKTIQSPCGW
jgi:hypothetical protein